MTRLKKELIKRKLIFNHYSDYDYYEECQLFVTISNKMIVLSHHSNVLDPILLLVDSNFNVFAEQLLFKSDHISFLEDDGNPWDVYFYTGKVVGEID